MTIAALHHYQKSKICMCHAACLERKAFPLAALPPPRSFSQSPAPARAARWARCSQAGSILHLDCLIALSQPRC